MRQIVLAILLLISSISAHAKGRELELVLDNVYEASFEWDAYFHVTFPEKQLPTFHQCSSIEADEIYQTIWSAVKNFRSHYPDEELPYSKAQKQLKEFLGIQPFWKCESIIEKGQYDIVLQLYVSANKKSVVQVEFERIKK